MQGNASASRSAIGSGLLTGLGTAAVSGSAAVAGAILSRRFGHGARTDGFFAAYALYLAIVLVASALRVIVLPRFARARGEGRLAREVGSWTAALTVPLAPVVLLAVAAPAALARLLAGSTGARDAAAEVLPWLMVAAAGQVYAGLAASALASFDDYGTAAFGFGAGAVIGLGLIVSLADRGIVAFGWGLAANAAVALACPLAALVARRAVGRPERPVGRRLRELVEGAVLPFALQGLFVIANRFAGGLGSGSQTTFSYAYLIAAFLVAVTATSVALVSSVPLTREGLTPARSGRHVVAASWLSLAVVAAAAGVFALAGESIVRAALGSSYGGDTGAELGRLVVYLAPWMVASVAVSVAFPLLFVLGRTRFLPLLSLLALGIQPVVVWLGREAFGLAGIAAGLAVTTALVLVVLLEQLRAFVGVVRGLAVAAAVCGGLAAIAFGVPGAVLGAVPASVVGLVLYTGALAAWRPPGLRTAWAYARALR